MQTKQELAALLRRAQDQLFHVQRVSVIMGGSLSPTSLASDFSQVFKPQEAELGAVDLISSSIKSQTLSNSFRSQGSYNPTLGRSW
mmetsp:Transcript_58065/g.105879  ORF Transcript_58065/g.105879 Transcript_58065/m.105879 type:complete len:86 (+) Transcript_58065:1-258(+)